MLLLLGTACAPAADDIAARADAPWSFSRPIARLSADSRTLYWAESLPAEGAHVVAMPKTGGTPAPLAPYYAAQIAVGGAFLYAEHLGTLSRIPIAGGAAKDIGSAPQLDVMSIGRVGHMAVDAASLYFGASAPCGWTFHRLPSDGGSAQLLWCESPGPSPCGMQDVFANDVDVMIAGSALIGLARTTCVTGTVGRVLRIPVTGGSAGVLLNDVAEPTGMAVDADAAYLTTCTYTDSAVLLKVPLGGGAPIVLASLSAPAKQCAGPLVVDAKYVTYGSDGALWRVLKTGGTPQKIADVSIRAGEDLVADDDSYYWNDGNFIAKLAKR